MTSPFKFNVAALPRAGGMPVQRTQTGPSPTRIGPEMIAIPEGGEVTVDASLTSLGGGFLVDADISATLHGECSRCLRTLTPEHRLHVSAVFSDSDDFITGDVGDEDEVDELPRVDRDIIDLLQPVIDKAGLSLPFNPVCQGGCPDDAEVPAPDGVSGDKVGVDPRWAGLEKFQ
ncbi:YceD family protein [Corynebacterium sp. A21]|uniref:YceD family protein n=1 Tax=Corynebacterium sp. A21 TaxID=3457318 RepID=UPI003FD34D38